MGKISGFILSLVCASAAMGLINAFLPDGTLKKYVRYLISLTMLLVLLSPFRELIGQMPSLAAVSDGDRASIDALARANSIVAMHIEESLIGKFALHEGEVDVRYDGEKILVSAKKRMGLIKSDIILYILNTYGVESEVELYE